LRDYHDKRIKEYNDDPVGFLVKHDKIIKGMNERLETLPEAEREAAEAEPLTCCLLL
jgi:hypothetical protein